MARRAKGSGTVVRIGKKWRARKRIGGDDVYGSLRDTKLQAERDLHRLRAPETGNRGVVPTVREYAETVLSGRYGRSLKRTTFETHDTIRVQWLNSSKLGKKAIDKVSHKDAQDFVDAIDRKPTYVRRIAAFASKLFTLAQRDPALDWHRENPFVGVEYPAVQERENRTLSPTEAISLLNPGSRVEQMLLVAMHTGLRRGELCGLRWIDLDDKGRVHVRRSIVPTKDGLKESTPKTRASVNIVPLTPEARAAIGSQPVRSEYVFTTDSGKPVSPHNLTRDFRVWAKKRGLAGMRLHDLRGTYISLLIESGADVRTVMELARHSDARTTLKAYARARIEKKDEAVAGFRELVTPQTAKPSLEVAV